MPNINPVDTSVYSGLGQSGQGMNLLGPVAQFASIQNALNQNALFQQTYKARAAMGPIAQASVDPATGQMDYGKFAVGISTHPDTAWMAPEVLNQLTQRQLTQAQVVNAKLDAEMKKQGALSAAAAGVLGEKGDNVKPEDLVGPAADLASRGILTHQEAASALAGLSGVKGPELAGHLRQLVAQGQRGSELISTVLGSYRPDAYVDAAGNKQGGYVSPLFNRITPTPVQAQAQAPQPQQAGGPQQPQAPTQPAQPVLRPTELGPMQKALLEKIAPYKEQVDEAADRARVAEQVITEMERAEKLGANTGGGASAYMKAAEFLQGAGVSNSVVDAVAGGDLSALQEFRKMALRLGTSELRTALLPGAGRLTNLEFEKFNENNPNVDLDPRTNAKLFSFMHRMNGLTMQKQQFFSAALENAQQGRPLARGLGSLTNFESWWNQQLAQRGHVSPEVARTLGGASTP